MATNIDVKRGQELLEAIDRVQKLSGSYAHVTQTGSGSPAVSLKGQLTLLVRDEAEQKKLIAQINAALTPIVEPYMARYIDEHRALAAPVKDKK